MQMEEKSAQDDLAGSFDSRFKDALLLSRTVEERRRQQIERQNAAIEAQLEQDRQSEILAMKRREEQKMLRRQILRYKMQEKLLKEREGRAEVDKQALERIKRYQELQSLRFQRKSQLDEQMMLEELEIRRKLHEARSSRPWQASSGEVRYPAEYEQKYQCDDAEQPRNGRNSVYSLPSTGDKAAAYYNVDNSKLLHYQQQAERHLILKPDEKIQKRDKPDAGQRANEKQKRTIYKPGYGAKLAADSCAAKLTIEVGRPKPEHLAAQQKIPPLKQTQAVSIKSALKAKADKEPCAVVAYPGKALHGRQSENAACATKLKAGSFNEQKSQQDAKGQVLATVVKQEGKKAHHSTVQKPKANSLRAKDEGKRYFASKSKDFSVVLASLEAKRVAPSAATETAAAAPEKLQKLRAVQNECKEGQSRTDQPAHASVAARNKYEETASTTVNYPAHTYIAQPPLRTSLSIAYSPAESGAILRVIRHKRAVSARVPRRKPALRERTAVEFRRKQTVAHANSRKYDPKASQLYQDKRFLRARQITQILALKRDEELNKRQKEEENALAEERQRQIAALKRADERKMQRRVEEQRRLHQRQAQRREMEALVRAGRTPAVVREAMREWKQRQAEDVRKSAAELERYEEAVRNNRTAM